MGSEHYCLRWNNHQSNLLGVFSQLLESESLVDVTLACTEGPSIRAHKVVLSACSSYFQTLFLDHPNRHPIVILKDVRFNELKTLVDFMYKGEVNVEYCQLSALLNTAESLKVKGLADMTNLNATSAVQASSSRDADKTEQNSTKAECLPQHDSQDERHRGDCKDREIKVEIKRETNSRERDMPHVTMTNECGGGGAGSNCSGPVALHNSGSNNGEDVDISDCPENTARGPSSPCQGPLALDRPRSRRDSDDANSMDDNVRGSSVSPVSVNSGPSDMSLSNSNNNNNNSSGTTTTSTTLPISNLSQSRLPSPHSTEPLAGPSGLPPVQQVPLSLKKEVDWDRSSEDRNTSSELSSDYRLPPDPVSLALGLESGNWSANDLAASDMTNSNLAAGLSGIARRCGVCLASFPSSWLLERHAVLQHAGQQSDDKPFTCEQCGQRYRYRSAYVKHREQNHRARLPADKLFTCDVCGMQFRYLKSFKKHRLNHALERLQRPSSNSESQFGERSDQVSSTGEPSNLETGSSAGDASPEPNNSEEMINDEISDQPIELSVNTRRNLNRASPVVEEDVPMTTDEDRQETIEETTTATPATVAVAAATTTPIGITNLISTETVINATLNRNNSSEAERRDRRFACPFCGKCVRSKENLKLHVRKHTGERPFVCLFCGRAFGGKSDLTRHLRIHTGERPYHCEMCGKCFARADYLSKHLTTHIHHR